MKVWKRHAIYVVSGLAVSQVLLAYAPPALFWQVLILTLSTNVAALIYAVILARTVEDAQEAVKPMLTSRVAMIVNQSYDGLSAERKANLERNIERLAAYGMVLVDRLAKMSEEELGDALGYALYGKTHTVTAEEVRAKMTLVSGA